ncbi:hypothetical protein [Peribacillus simplex]|uniref:hypothetical protein n=1 Tax=Peribacillus simplex TaxID=1478 RepID=UPI003D27BE12
MLPDIEKAKIEGEISSTVDKHWATAAFWGILVQMLYGGHERLMKRPMLLLFALA